ncbi:helicase [Ensifer sp. LCM 4579]|uniref:helicase n=1 Tax=Ensifer sp. LCM 4579 TaxID=1848292 RepID=UPI0008DAAE90|nr:helicase [Ensifer sp. LCM 4579]OHV72849.1 helicase [Ensifer sp. LCM 4579]
MRKHLAATFVIAIAIGPASALALDLGASVGPVGVGAEVGISKSGASAGVGTNVDGIGGVKGGTSLGTKGGSSLGVGGNLGGKSGGISVGSGSKAGATDSGAGSGGSASGSGSGTRSPSSGGAGGSTAVSSGGGGSNTIGPVAPARTARASIVLPRVLWPLKRKRAAQGRGEWAYPLSVPLSIAAIPGTPSTVVRTCRKAIASAASPLGAVRVRAASAGSLLRHRSGVLTAPLAVSIDYAGQDGIQVRQARVSCRLDSSGKVIAVI